MVEERFCIDCGKSSRAWVGAIETTLGGVCGTCAQNRCSKYPALLREIEELGEAGRTVVEAADKAWSDFENDPEVINRVAEVLKKSVGDMRMPTAKRITKKLLLAIREI
jgi:hypothetical protein